MSFLSALFGNATPNLPVTAGGAGSFGERLLSGSPINRLLNGPFPNAPKIPGQEQQAKPAGKLSSAFNLAAMMQPQQAMQPPPMPMQPQGQTLGEVIAQYMQQNRGR